MPHISADLQANVVALASERTGQPAPTGTAVVHTNPAMIDTGELAAQRAAAMERLATDPKDVDALRVVVSAACASKDVDTARKYAETLPPGDRAAMNTACRASGVQLDTHDTWKAGTAPPAPPKQRPPR